jgi:radical SAM protein with 4Fe4S-binding SPASM domain
MTRTYGYCSDDHGLWVIPRRAGAQLLDRRSGAVGSFEGVLAQRLLERCEHGVADGSLRGLAAALGADADSLLGRALTAHFHPIEGVDLLLGSGGGMLWLELSGRCNERCVHCYADAGPEVERGLAFETIERCLRDAWELGFTTVQFTGGDPLLAPTLEPAIALASAIGLRVEVYTNALALHARRAAALARAGVRLAVSVYGSDPARHDAMTGVVGSHARTVAGLRRALDAGLEVRVGLVEGEGDADETEQTRAWLQAMGVTHVGVDRVRATGRGAAFVDARGGEATVAATDALALPVADDFVDHGMVDASARAAVTWDGRVLPCIFAREHTLGHIEEQSLAEILRATRPLRAFADERWQHACERMTCQRCRLACTLLEEAAP